MEKKPSRRQFLKGASGVLGLLGVVKVLEKEPKPAIAEDYELTQRTPQGWLARAERYGVHRSATATCIPSFGHSETAKFFTEKFDEACFKMLTEKNV